MKNEIKEKMYQLAQKAYEIDFSKIVEGYCYGEAICYAENRNKAKLTLLSEYTYLRLNKNDEYADYLTIPVIRCKQADKYQFEDKELTLLEIEEIINERNRVLELDKILADNFISHCYIKKGSYYRPNSCGYTDFIHRAGVYTKEEAVSSAKSCSKLTIVPIDIEAHNKMIEAEIADLKTRIIN